jgi:viroplasmin and RNaseH domain-containing protein
MTTKRANLYVNWSGMPPVSFYKQFPSMEAAKAYAEEVEKTENYRPLWHFKETDDV